MYSAKIQDSNQRLERIPFICSFMPFVCFKKPSNLPLVGLNIPLIRNSGFSVIELIITLTIASVLLMIAGPGLQTFVSSNRLTSQTNDLLADISLARSESIKRHTTTGLCPSTTGTGCTAGGNWASGWLVYYDNGGTTTALKLHEALTGNNTLTLTKTDVVASTTSSADIVAYGASGILLAQTYTYRFTVCDPGRNRSRVIDLTVLGQTSVSDGTC